eukprot:13363394-Ditylum_brightwellii.AAC.1
MLHKGNTLTVFKQAEIARGTQTVPHFNKCLHGIAEHVFPEKTGQIQKCYMWSNLCYTKDLTVKEWIAQEQELSRYLKDFLAHNTNPMQPLHKNEVLDILEFGSP